jgi:hypothetical protein
VHYIRIYHSGQELLPSCCEKGNNLSIILTRWETVQQSASQERAVETDVLGDFLQAIVLVSQNLF